MTDYADVYYVDGRNADFRTGQHGNWANIGRPMVQAPSVAHPVRTLITQPAYPYGQGPITYGPQGPGYWGPHGWVPQAVPGYWGPQSGTSVFGQMSTGALIDMVAQIFAALMPLPAAPVATSDAATDVGNLILYQGSLASYTKRDEQVRTLGNLVQKLVG